MRERPENGRAALSSALFRRLEKEEPSQGRPKKKNTPSGGSAASEIRNRLGFQARRGKGGRESDRTLSKSINSKRKKGIYKREGFGRLNHSSATQNPRKGAAAREETGIRREGVLLHKKGGRRGRTTVRKETMSHGCQLLTETDWGMSKQQRAGGERLTKEVA